jgi:hypothetical protein
MTRQMVVSLAKELGWKPWGKMRPYTNGSKYQCFRRGKTYAWIGNRYVEKSTREDAQDYVGDRVSVTRAFLE